MARTSRKDEASGFYPPRSRWNSRILYTAGRPLRCPVTLQKLRPALTFSAFCWVLSLVVPGLPFLLVGRRPLGWLVLAAYLPAALVLVARLDYPIADIGYAFVVSLHATSIVFVEWLWLKAAALWVKVIAAIATLIVVWGFIYAPLFGSAESPWLMPRRPGEGSFSEPRAEPLFGLAAF